MSAGGCHCGAIRYSVEGDPAHSALCHCSDCCKSAGAPMVGWALFSAAQVAIEGEPVKYRSSENATRHFCAHCGTGLFYTNDVIFPGMIDVQTGTLDDSTAYPPTARIQVAEAAHWMEHISDLPKFERYPG